MADVVLQGISVKVDLAPGGNPEGSLTEVGALINFPEILSKTRNVTKYNPINSDTQHAVAGRKVIDPITMDVLYDPEGNEGVNKLNQAIDDNEQVQIVIELPNAKTDTGHGTQYTFLAYVSGFKITGDEDGLIKASVTCEITGDVTVNAAT